MKNYVSISLFVFWAVVVAILTAGLVFYNGNKNQTQAPLVNISTSSTSTVATTTKTAPPVVTTKPKPPANTNVTQTPVTPVVTPPAVTIPTPTPPNNSTILTAAEVATHNTASNCWMIISGKVYNFTSFIPSHPGGSSMVPYCGRDGTSSFVSGPPHRHSSFADSLLPNYYIGDLNQAVSASQTPLLSPTSTAPALPANFRGGDDEDNDD